MAVARQGVFGFGYSFQRLSRPKELTTNITGCLAPCKDDTSKACGSADGYGGAKASRVWAVYSLPSVGDGSTTGS